MQLATEASNTTATVSKKTELEGNPKGHGIQLLALHSPPNNPSMCLRVLSKCPLSSLGAMTNPWGACSVPHHPLCEKPCPNIHPKPPLAQLYALPSGPVTEHLREEISLCSSDSPPEEAADCAEVCLQAPPG